MDVILAILSPLIWLLQTALSIVLWLVWQILWIALWFLLPFAVLAYVALKIAEKMLGEAPVRAWLKQRAATYAGGLGERLSRGALAISVLPFRVIVWFLIYTVQHSIVSLLWTPRWKPWPRAWAKRWKPTAPNGARVTTAPPQPKRA